MKLGNRQARRVGAVAAIFALALGSATACTSSSGGSRGSGKTITIAQAGTQTNYIFPFFGPNYATVQNVQQFQALMYRPLYWFGVGIRPVLNEALSLADPPKWSNDNRTATIHLKDHQWSNGEKLTPKNVAFWLGLDRTMKKKWAYYNPGSIPDDLASVSYDDAANTVTFNLNKPVSPTNFLDAELGQIVPLPLAWDLTGKGQKGTCASEQVTDQDRSCPAVHEYLSGESKNPASYVSSPIWQVVNGPFKLASYQTGIGYSFVPNTMYSGPQKPTIDRLTFKFFTSDTAEYNALRSGAVDVGFVPPANLPAKQPSETVGRSPIRGYTLSPVPFFGWYQVLINFNNAKAGPIFRQLYIRQALQSVVDQETAIAKANQGYGYPQYSPIPQEPQTPFISEATKTNPYPFDPDHAKQLLESHGWSVPSSGAATCQRPGSGPDQCGPGVPQGARLEFKLEETAGNIRVEEIMQQLAADASKAGIKINIVKETGNQVVGNLIACKPHEPTCGWQLINAGGNVYTSPYPSGQPYFATAGSQNFGSYADPTMDSLIAKTLTSSSPRAVAAYEEYAAKQVPVLWQPSYPLQVAAVSDKVKGALPLSRSITPEYWSVS